MLIPNLAPVIIFLSLIQKIFDDGDDQDKCQQANGRILL